jgi:hypothetical protein
LLGRESAARADLETAARHGHEHPEGRLDRRASGDQLVVWAVRDRSRRGPTTALLR